MSDTITCYLVDTDGNRYAVFKLNAEQVKTIQTAITEGTPVLVDQQVAFAAGRIIGLVNASNFASPAEAMEKGMQGHIHDKDNKK